MSHGEQESCFLDCIHLCVPGCGGEDGLSASFVLEREFVTSLFHQEADTAVWEV